MSNLSIVFLSDTHARRREVNLPAGDLLIHGGDVSNGRAKEEKNANFFTRQPITQAVKCKKL